MKRIKAFAICLAAVVLLTGCWDAVEIEDQFLVWVMGWDVPKENPDKILLTLSSPTIGEDVKEPYVKFSAIGNSVEAAKNNIQQYLYRKIELGHMRILLIGKEFAERGILKHLDPLGRNPKIGRQTLIIVVDGRAQDLYELNNPGVARPGEYLVELITRNAKGDNALDSTFRDFFECISQEGREPATAFVKLADNKFGFNSAGLGVFKDDRLVGSLYGIELQVYLLIRNLAHAGSLTTGNAIRGQVTTYKYYRHKTKIQTEVIDGVPHATVKIRLEGDIDEYTAKEAVNSTQAIQLTERSFSQGLEEQFIKTIKKCQNDYQSDIFGFGAYFRAFHPGYWNSVDWDDEFPKLKVNVTVDVKIRRVGIES